jgi:hypothetical protein
MYTSEGEMRAVLPQVPQYTFPDEPRFSCTIDQFDELSDMFWSNVDPAIRSKELWESEDAWLACLEYINKCPDEYLKMTFQGMFIKQAHNNKNAMAVIDGFKAMKDSSWKVSALRFLSRNKLYKDNALYRDLYLHFRDDIIDYIERKGE